MGTGSEGFAAAAIGAVMNAVVALAAGWWEGRWCADVGQLLCMIVVCLSAGSLIGRAPPL